MGIPVELPEAQLMVLIHQQVISSGQTSAMN